MNAERLLAHYERIADAPDAVKRLRQFVLDLAVRGKLVPQSQMDEPASRLLAEVERRTGESTAIGELKEPFEIPSEWMWSTVGRLSTKTGSGSTPRGGKAVYKNEGVPFLRSQNVHNDGLRLDDVAYIDRATHQRMNGTAVLAGDLLLNITGGSIGRCCHIEDPDIEANISQHVAIIRTAVSEMAPFLHTVVLSPYFQSYVVNEQTGAGRGGLPKNRMDKICVPVPPLAEQCRILARLNELMALCDQLEAARLEREATRDQLAAASFSRLNSPDSETFAADVRFALDTLSVVTARADQIKQLRRTILELAVRGRLVAQDPKDQSAQDWVRSIKGDIHKVDLLLPPTWCWTQLGTMVVTMDAGWSPQCEDHPRHDSAKWGVLKTTAVQALAFDWRHHKELPAKLEPRPQYEAREADILVTRAGPKNRVGVCCVVENVEPRLMISDKLIRFRLVDGPCARYIALSLNAGHSYECVEAAKSGMAVMQMNISQDKLRAVPIPLPPLAEQERIVARVDELMVLCDQLETSLATADDTRRRLLDALLHEALAPITKPSREHARAAVSGYLVSRLASKRNFGRTAHMKHLYFAESLLGLDLGGRYMREAAGPLDTGIYELEKRAEAAGWYTHSVETLPSGNEKVSYQPGKALKAIAEEGITVLGRSRAEMDRLIDLMGGLKTESVEIIATLFAAWNDALLDEQTPDDNWIIKEVREHWHVSKQRFTPADLKQWLGWMRQNDVVPLGHAPRTMHQTTMEF